MLFIFVYCRVGCQTRIDIRYDIYVRFISTHTVYKLYMCKVCYLLQSLQYAMWKITGHGLVSRLVSCHVSIDACTIGTFTAPWPLVLNTNPKHESYPMFCAKCGWNKLYWPEDFEDYFYMLSLYVFSLCCCHPQGSLEQLLSK